MRYMTTTFVEEHPVWALLESPFAGRIEVCMTDEDIEAVLREEVPTVFVEADFPDTYSAVTFEAFCTGDLVAYQIHLLLSTATRHLFLACIVEDEGTGGYAPSIIRNQALHLDIYRAEGANYVHVKLGEDENPVVFHHDLTKEASVHFLFLAFNELTSADQDRLYEFSDPSARFNAEDLSVFAQEYLEDPGVMVRILTLSESVTSECSELLLQAYGEDHLDDAEDDEFEEET